MFGGADPSISGLVPSDIEIRRNHFFKPPSWKGVWTVKNLFELKSAQRVLIEGNVMENNWVDGQVGFAILLKSVNPGGKCTWCITQDITFRYNRIRNSANGVNIIATPQGTVAGPVRRVQFRHNIIENIDVGPIYYGTGRLFQLLEEITDLSIEHNTTFSNGGDQLISFGSMPVLVRLAFRDNVANRGRYGIKGGGVGEGTPSLNTYAPTYDVRGNVIIGAAASSYPTSNYFPSTVTATGFVGYSTGNYRLTSSSAYSGMATDGSDPGADIAGVESATANVTSGTGGGTIPAGSPSSPTPTLPPPDTTTAPAPSPTPTPSSLYTVSVPSTTIAVGTTVVGTASLPTGVRRVRWAVSQWKPLTLSGVGAPKSEQMGIVGLAAGGDWVRVRWLDDNDVVLHADSIWMTVGSSTTTSPTSSTSPTTADPLPEAPTAPTSPYVATFPSTTLSVGSSVVASATLPPGTRRVRWAVSQWRPLTLSGVGALQGERIEVKALSSGTDWVRIRWYDDADRLLHADSVQVTVQ